MVSFLKKVLCGLLVLNGGAQAVVKLSPYCPIKRIDALEYPSWQKSGMKAATNLAGTVLFHYVTHNLIGVGEGEQWYNGPVALELSQAIVLAGGLATVAPLASELSTDLGNEISQLSVDLPMSMVAGTAVEKGLEAKGVKLASVQKAYVQAGSLATRAAMRKAGKFIGKQIS